MSATLDSFLPLVLPYVPTPGPPDPLVARCLRDAAIAFCERTMLWRSNATIVTDGTNGEVIPMPSGDAGDGVLHEIISCSIAPIGSDGTCAKALDPISVYDLARDMPAWRNRTIGDGCARWYVCPDFGTVQAVPRASGNLFVEYVIKPTATATNYPDFMFDLYANTIAEGAAGYVNMKPFEFANPQLGAALLANFNSELDSLFAMGRKGQQKAPTRTVSRYF